MTLLAAEEVSAGYDRRLVLDGVSLALQAGEALGVVGESGCGKSTLLRVLLRLLPASSGTVRLHGRDITRSRDLADLRRDVQIVFQNPRAALDPRYTVLDAVAEPLGGRRSAGRDRVAALLDDVGLGADYLRRYPHELSGGQAQRVCIARALAPGPRALLLDEPTSALDVSVQAQVIELLDGLRARHGLALLFVSHDLSVVQLLCERVAVMHHGRVVEEGPVDDVLRNPRDPYTVALLDAVLSPRATLQGLIGTAAARAPRWRAATRSAPS